MPRYLNVVLSPLTWCFVLYKSTSTSLRESIVFFFLSKRTEKRVRKTAAVVGYKMGYTGLDLMQLISVKLNKSRQVFSCVCFCLLYLHKYNHLSVFWTRNLWLPTDNDNNLKHLAYWMHLCIYLCLVI